jgi:hypothetical protein
MRLDNEVNMAMKIMSHVLWNKLSRRE